MLKIKKHRRTGFTLIELLVVILIIGILAAIALPQYKRIVLHTRFTQTIISLNALIKAQEIYYMTNNVFVTNLNNLDTEVATDCGVNGNYISCVLSNNGKQLAILQYHLYHKRRYCCSYYGSDFVADDLCETEMHNSHWYNGCSESRPCHCYQEM